jgi:hypothetical protein
MSNKDAEYDTVHTCSNPEITFNHIKGLYHIAMIGQGLKPHDIAAIEKRVEELSHE